MLSETRMQVRDLLAEDVSHGLIARLTGWTSEQIENEARALIREAEARRRETERRTAARRSMGWAGPKPEQGNLVSLSEAAKLRRMHGTMKRARKSLTATIMGDPEPHHKELRDERASDPIRLWPGDGHANNIGSTPQQVQAARAASRERLTKG